MNQKIQDDTRKHVSRFLPEAIATALRSYERFAGREPADDAKEFSAHHTACKVAIAHIELLIKLARWAELPDPNADDPGQQAILGAMIGEAEQELLRYRRLCEEGADG